MHCGWWWKWNQLLVKGMSSESSPSVAIKAVNLNGQRKSPSSDRPQTTVVNLKGRQAGHYAGYLQKGLWLFLPTIAYRFLAAIEFKLVFCNLLNMTKTDLDNGTVRECY